jgi:hypothetical protein
MDEFTDTSISPSAKQSVFNKSIPLIWSIILEKLKNLDKYSITWEE